MKILTTFFVLLFSSSLVAEEFASWGIVEDTCENSLRVLNIAEEIGNFEHELTIRIYRGVLQAYMSGVNFWIYEEFGMFKNLNFNSVEYAYSYLINYCEKNPKNVLGDGILQYLLELPYIEN